MRVNKVVEPDTAPKSPTIDRHCVTLLRDANNRHTSYAGRVYEGGGTRVERKERYVRVDGEWV